MPKRKLYKLLKITCNVFGWLKIVKIKESVSKFIKVRCPKCNNEQITFGKTAVKVDCLVCGKTVAEPTGGKSRVKARILEVLE